MNIDLLRKSDFNFCTLKYGGCSKLDMYLSTRDSQIKRYQVNSTFYGVRFKMLHFFILDFLTE